MSAAPLDEPSEPTPRGRWAALLVAIVFVLLGLAAWLVGSDVGPIPPFLGGARPAAPAGDDTRESEVLDLAGSGSNLPITRALAATWPSRVSELPVVHDSIGSGGGVRALLDDAIDLALVSRPLAPTERELGLVEIPYARVPVVAAVNARVVDEDLEPEDLLAIYAGERTTWSDGSPIVVLMRERGDSSHRAIAAMLPGFGQVSARAWDEDRFRVLYHDDDMREAIAATVGAIGLFGQGAVPPGVPIRALRISGVVPSAETVRSGKYPYAKDLVFVSRGAPRGLAARFVAFSHSESGREVVRRMGGWPLGEVGS